MSHEVTHTNGKAEMAYVGEKPWWQGGNELPANATIEQWLAAAGMQWKVERGVVRYATDRSGTMRQWADKIVLMRSDNKNPLGLVSDSYKVVQPAEVMEFFRDMVASQNFALETAGTLRGGQIYWALAKINAEAKLPGGDLMRGHVLLSTSADGSRKTEAANVATRVVCMNTLRMSDGEAGKARVKTSHRSVFDADAVKATLGIAHQSFERFMAQARVLADRKLSAADVQALTIKILGPVDAEAQIEMTQAQVEEIMTGRAATAILAKYRGDAMGAGLASVKGTAWGFLNAVTEYVDHDKPARSADNRLVSAWFGPGDALKSKAMGAALSMV